MSDRTTGQFNPAFPLSDTELSQNLEAVTAALSVDSSVTNLASGEKVRYVLEDNAGLAVPYLYKKKTNVTGFRPVGEAFAFLGSSAPEGSLALNGQVVLRATYSELDEVCYVGDGRNGTADGFYRTSDSDGTTRSTTGDYLVLPDARGAVLVGTGTQTYSSVSHSGPSTANMQQDRMQQITGSLDSLGNTVSDAGIHLGSSGALSDTTGTDAANSLQRSTANTARSMATFDSANSPNARTGATTRAFGIGVLLCVQAL